MCVIVTSRKVSVEVNGSIKNKTELKSEEKLSHTWFINLGELQHIFKVKITTNLTQPPAALVSSWLQKSTAFSFAL